MPTRALVAEIALLVVPVLAAILMNSHIVSTLVHPLTRFFLHLAG